MEQKRDNEEMEIDLRELWGVIASRWMIIVLTACLFGVIAFAYAKLMVTPQYHSTTSIYVMNQQDTGSVTSSDLQTGQFLTNDYMVIIKGRSVLEQVIYKMGLNMSYEQLRAKTSVSSDEDTRIINITVRDQDPYMAKELASAVREAASEKIASVMDIASVKMLEEANLPDAPSGTGAKKMTFLGMMVGLVLSVGLILLRYLLNDTVRTAEDVEKYLGLSILGSIPMDEEKNAQHLKKRKLKKKK